MQEQIDLTLLTEREREVLRLLATGHDAKSAAAELSLSVHTINDHLREARRKLGVSSSREAARLLARQESGDPKFSGAQQFRIGEAPKGGAAGQTGARRPLTHLVIGAAVMSLMLAAAVWFLGNGNMSPSAAAGVPPTVVVTKPGAGQVINPGPFLLSVTFDRPMIDRSYSFVRTAADSFPQCQRDPVLSADARTYSWRCTAVSGRS